MGKTTTVGEDVALSEFISDNSEIKIKVDAGDILRYIEDNFEPEDVFSERLLAAWAVQNGYEKIE